MKDSLTETPYLIAHKVRGQPTFDIAIQMEMEDEVWWIIPTSGHRAYPYWHIPLMSCISLPEMTGWQSCPDPWPDHYWQPGQTSDLVIPDNAGSSLLSALGLPTKAAPEPIRRR